MEAVTDVVFRHVVKKAAAPDVYFTEFTNATGWAAVGDKATGGRLLKTDDEHPLVAQLWGAKPEAMAALSQHCAEVGFDGLDLNTGCPDSSATKSGAGSALIKNPELTAQLIAAMKTSGLPVSVKTRLGYSSVDERRDWITFLLEQDIVALTVHLRTKKEMSKVPAHWELMKEIRELRDQIAPQTLLIGNGDIMNKAEAAKLMQESGIDGVMVGRGIFHDPWFFEQNPSVHPLAEHIALLRYQLDLFEATWADQPRSFDPLKRFFKVYVRNFPEAAHVRDQLMHTRTIPEARAVLDEAFGPVLS
jgi:tRNA-dihydrouridine synthase